MAVYITGDIHGEPTRFSIDNFPEQRKFSDDKDENIVIIAGDFGLIWDREKESKEEKYWLKWFEEKNYTTVFVDGNHENFERLNHYPVVKWHGGNVHVIRPNLLHLMRGEIFDMEGKKFFTFGGASSHDISDGILDFDDEGWKNKAKALEKREKYLYRVKGLSWWENELPTPEEMKNGIRSLNVVNHNVNYIITHCPPQSIMELFDNYTYSKDYLTMYLEKIKEETEYDKWIFGHMHENKQIDDKHICLYEQIIRLL